MTSEPGRGEHPRSRKVKDWTQAHPALTQIIVCAAIVLGMGGYTFVFSDSNLGKQYRYAQRIKTLQREYREHVEAYRQDSLKIEHYKQDLGHLERLAREEYHMQRPDEIVFLIKDPDTQTP